MIVNADGSYCDGGDVCDDHAASLADWPAPGAAPTVTLPCYRCMGRLGERLYDRQLHIWCWEPCRRCNGAGRITPPPGGSADTPLTEWWPVSPRAAPAEDCDGPTQRDPRDDDL